MQIRKRVHNTMQHKRRNIIFLICLLALISALICIAIFGKNLSLGRNSEINFAKIETEAEAPSSQEDPAQSHTVWIDAGHGGTDWGSAEWVRDSAGNIIDADGNIVSEESELGERVTSEKDDTLELALALKEALEERGITVLMTRTEDITIDRFERCDLINASDAECLVSIHRNYLVGDCDFGGIEAWICNPQTESEIDGKEQQTDLANDILDELAKTENGGILGCKRNSDPDNDISILCRTSIPAVLLEMGYMSNDSDNELFRENTEEYAAAIADGIVLWLQEH